MTSTTGSEPDRGLFERYRVERLDDLKRKHHDCNYFVLDVTHDPFVIPALRAYATACREKYPKLSADLTRLAHNAQVKAHESGR